MPVREKMLNGKGLNGQPQETKEILKLKILITNNDGDLKHTIIGKRGGMRALGIF